LVNEHHIPVSVNPDNHLKSRPRPPSGAAPAPLPLLPGPIKRLLQKYPGLVRHPHPFTVHFPIVFFYLAAVFTLTYLATGSTRLEASAFYFLIAGTLFLPLTMITGEISRRVFYPDEPAKVFHIEIYYSWVLLVLAAAACLWRGLNPLVLAPFRWTSFIYLLIILALPAIATYISFFGGLLTFPLDKEK
jgi:uncharacterized membrane protein